MFALFAIISLGHNSSTRKALEETKVKFEEQLLPVSQVETQIKESAEIALTIDGNTGSDKHVTEVNMTLVPSDKLLLLSLQNLNGTVSLTRGKFITMPLENYKDLMLKIKTPPLSEKVGMEGYEPIPFPSIYLPEISEGISVEFEFTDLKDVKEAEAFIYTDNTKVPPCTVVNSDYDFELKSKEVVCKDYSLVIDGKHTKCMIGYFEVTSKKKGLPPGAIAGIAVGSVAAVAGISVGAFFAIRHLRKLKVTG